MPTSVRRGLFFRDRNTFQSSVDTGTNEPGPAKVFDRQFARNYRRCSWLPFREKTS